MKKVNFLVNISSIVVRRTDLAAQAINRVQIRLDASAVEIQVSITTTRPARVATAWIRRTSTALTQNQPDTVQIL